MSGAHAATQKPLDKSKVAWWTIAAPFLGIVTVFILTVLDPLEFESVTKHHSANVFYKIYGAAYPPRVRDSISVVMLDNNTLNNLFRESWPPSHAVHSAVLSAILQYKPAAVLVDMFFFHEVEMIILQILKLLLISTARQGSLFSLSQPARGSGRPV